MERSNIFPIELIERMSTYNKSGEKLTASSDSIKRRKSLSKKAEKVQRKAEGECEGLDKKTVHCKKNRRSTLKKKEMHWKSMGSATRERKGYTLMTLQNQNAYMQNSWSYSEQANPAKKQHMHSGKRQWKSSMKVNTQACLRRNPKAKQLERIRTR